MHENRDGEMWVGEQWYHFIGPLHNPSINNHISIAALINYFNYDKNDANFMVMGIVRGARSARMLIETNLFIVHFPDEFGVMWLVNNVRLRNTSEKIVETMISKRWPCRFGPILGTLGRRVTR